MHDRIEGSRIKNGYTHTVFNMKKTTGREEANSLKLKIGSRKVEFVL